MRAHGRPALVKVLLAALFIASFLGATPARADHMPGGTYTGVAVAGGTVQFAVSADGTQVTSFTASDVPCSGGGTGSGTVNNIPISGPAPFHTFSGSAGGLGVSGGFGADETAGGTILLAPPICPAPTMTNFQCDLQCMCIDVLTKTKLKKVKTKPTVIIFIFETRKSVVCVGKAGMCQATIKFEVRHPKAFATIPKADRTTTCTDPACVGIVKDVTYRLIVDRGWLEAGGKRVVRGRLTTICDLITTERKQSYVFDKGDFNKKASNLGDHA